MWLTLILVSRTCDAIGLRHNLVPRVLRLLGQRVVTERESGVLEGNEIVTTRILRFTVLSFVTVNSQSTSNKKNQIFPLPQSLSSDYPRTKKPEDSGYEIVCARDWSLTQTNRIAGSGDENGPRL